MAKIMNAMEMFVNCQNRQMNIALGSEQQTRIIKTINTNINFLRLRVLHQIVYNPYNTSCILLLHIA